MKKTKQKIEFSGTIALLERTARRNGGTVTYSASTVVSHMQLVHVDGNGTILEHNTGKRLGRYEVGGRRR